MILKLAAIGAIGFALAVVPSLYVLGEQNASVDFSNIPDAGAARFVFTGDSSLSLAHYPPYFLSENGGLFMSNGLFVESSLSSKYFSEIRRGLVEESVVWGSVFSPSPYAGLDENSRKNLVLGEMKLLGVRGVISAKYLPALSDGKNIGFLQAAYFRDLGHSLLWFNGVSFGPKSSLFYYDLGEPKMALAVTKADFGESFSNWRNESLNNFFSPSQVDQIVVNSVEQDWNFAFGNEDVNLIGYGKDFSKFSVDINSSKEIPVLVKVSYFPNWHAYSNGKEIKIFRAGPNFMLINAKGRVDFDFEKSPPEWIAIIISIAAFVILLSAFFLPKYFQPAKLAGRRRS